MLPTEYLEESNPRGGEVGSDNMLIDAVVDLREATAFFIEGVLIPVLAVFGIIGECKFFLFRFDNTRSPIAFSKIQTAFLSITLGVKAGEWPILWVMSIY